MTNHLDVDRFLADLHLEAGGHDPDSKFCIMEATAYIAGEPWSGAPKCSNPVTSRRCR